MLGQVVAGGGTVESRAAFASPPEALGLNPRRNPYFLDSAQVDRKPFSFHFRAKGNRASVDEGPAERNPSHRGKASGASRGRLPHSDRQDLADDATPTAPLLTSTTLETARKIIRSLQTPTVSAGAATTDVESHPGTESRSAELGSTTLETARKIIRELQTPAVAAGAVATDAESPPGTETRSAELGALFGNLKGPGEFFAVAPSQKPESPSQAATPETRIEQAPAVLRASVPSEIPHLERGARHTFSGEPATIPETAIEQARAGLRATISAAISQLEQGNGRAFSDHRASDPSSELVMHSGLPYQVRGKQRNPVENLRVTDAVDAADLVTARTLMALRPDVPTHSSALPLPGGGTLGSIAGESTQQYRDPGYTGKNRVSATADAVDDHGTASVGARRLRLDDLSPEFHTLNVDFKSGYRIAQPAGIESLVAGVPGPSTHFERSPQAAAGPANAMFSGASSGPRLSRVAVPRGPQGNAADKASALPFSAAHFSLRPAGPRGDERASGAISTRRFSTGNPQAELARLSASVDLKTAGMSRKTQSNDTGSSRSPRSVGAPAAESHLLENDPRSGRAAQLGAEKVSTRSLSPSAPQGTAEAATSARTLSSNTASRSPRSVGVQAAEGYLLENDPGSGRAAQLGAEKVSTRSLSPSAPQGTAEAATSARTLSSNTTSPARPAGSTHLAPEAAQPLGDPTPTSRHSKTVTASELVRADADVASSRQATAPIRTAAANLAASGQATVSLAGILRRERGQQVRRSGPQSAQTEKGPTPPEQPEGQSLLLEVALSKRHLRAAQGNHTGRPFPNGRSDSEKPDASRSAALPATHRSASNTFDTAAQPIPRGAEQSPQAPNALSRTSDLNTRAQESHLVHVRAVERVVEMASLQKNADSNQMNIVLRDSQLGRISLRLVERNGLIETLLRTDSSRTGQLIGEKLPQMLESLSQRGFDAAHDGSGQWTGSQQDQRQGGGRQRPPPARPPGSVRERS